MTEFGRTVARISGPPCLRHACAAAFGVVILLAIVLPCRAAPEIAPTRTRHVALLVGERAYLPDPGMLETELVRTLTSNPATRVEIHREAIDVSDSSDYLPLLRDFLRAKYAGKKIDAVVAVMGPALDFLLSYGDSIFPGASIVFCGIEKRELAGRALPPHVRGLVVKREFRPTLDFALKFHPETKQIVVVAGASAFDVGLAEQARDAFRSYQDRYTITYPAAPPLDELLAGLARLSPQTVVLYTSFFQDGAGQTLAPSEVVERVSEAANGPVYGVLDQDLGHGIVGGNLSGSTTQGAETGKIVLQVLTGAAAPTSQLLEAQSGEWLFDWRQMQRWGIGAESLPQGSEIYFRQAGAWERYRLQILAVAAALLVQAGLITWLVQEHRRRQAAEILVRSSMAELNHMNRLATAGELSASIAHEVNQPLAGIAMMANAALRWLAAERPNVEKAHSLLTQIVSASRHASEVIASVRTMFKKDSAERVPIDVNKLVSSVLTLVAVDLHKDNIELQTALDARIPAVEGDPVQLQQVVLNLVINAIESMRAQPVRVLRVKTSESEPGSVQVSVEDTGTGIDPADMQNVFKPLFTTKARGMGMGLAICRSIIEKHDGRISVTPGAKGGSIFRFELPASAAK